ncbi:DUF1080 domain-containing protein [Candidatus Woesearchaeota archaeon]|nr:DUF1080 domain-containing protein [Candidatus Woesearchaeota archaeon]
MVKTNIKKDREKWFKRKTSLAYILLLFMLCIISSEQATAAADWWNSSYLYRSRLNISSSGTEIPKDYTINIIFNTSGPVIAGKMKADGSDLMVVYWNSSANIMLDRINHTGFNSTETEIMFRISSNISDFDDNYYLYYGNPAAADPPENMSEIYYHWEDFEDQTHDFTNGPLNPVVNMASARNGNYGLEGDGLAGYSRAVKPEYLAAGMTIEAWVYSGYAGDNADLPGIAFGMQSSGDQRYGYQVVLDWRSGTGGTSDMQIRENYNSATPLDTSTENTVTADTWYYISATWKGDGDIEATIYDSDMDHFGSLNTNDGTYTSGYYGVVAYRDGFWDDVLVKLYIKDEPAVSVLAEEAQGPDILNGTATPGALNRDEKTNITAKITSNNYLDKVWINITAPDSTTEKLFMENTSSVYNLTYVSGQVGIYNARIYANDTNGIVSESGIISWAVYGWAEAAESYLSPAEIIQSEQATMRCRIRDANTSSYIENYPVSFYSNKTGYLGSNITNATGWAELTFTDDYSGLGVISCIISDNDGLFYNATANNSMEKIINVSVPPTLTIISAGLDKNEIGYGDGITISAIVTSPGTIGAVLFNVTYPDMSVATLEGIYRGSDTYDADFIDSWKLGDYTVQTWANDSLGSKKTGENMSFNISSDMTMDLGSGGMEYGPNEEIPLFSASQGWWDPAYGYRKKLTITNNDAEELKANYTINFTINTTGLVTGSKMLADCDDLRIVWDKGLQSVELDRIVSSCNGEATEVLFALQEGIISSGSDSNYYIYYGRADASNPPDDPGEVYLVYDDFESYALGSAPGNGWTDDPEYTTNNWQVVDDSGNNAVQDMATDGVYHRLWKGYDNWDDYRIDARVKLDAFLFSGITFRRQEWSGSYYNHYAMITDDRASTNKIVLRRWNGGGSSYAVLSGEDTDFDGLSWHNYTIEIIGNDVRLYRDNAIYIDYDISGSSPAYSTGSHVGLMSHQGQTMFDDVIVRLLVADEPEVATGYEEVLQTGASLDNNGLVNNFICLLMTVQYNNSGTWQDIGVVINDSSTSTKRGISAGSGINLSIIWESEGFNSAGLESGTYRIYSAATDIFGKILSNTNSSAIEESKLFYIDADAPAIEQLLPAANSAGVNQTTVFSFEITDDDIDYCSLILDGSVVLTNYSVAAGAQVFALPDLETGEYEWQVECHDIYGNAKQSTGRTITIIPTYSFDGLTTDLNQVDITDIPELIIENSSSGLINLSGPINLSGGADINKYLRISHNHAEIDTAKLTQLNRQAVITLYDVSLQKPVILRDGQLCTDCTILSHTADIVFNVTHFTTYSASENSALAVWDDSDLSQVYPYENILFYANYSNKTSGLSITDAVCNLTINTTTIQMTYNASSGLHEYNTSFSLPGARNFTVSCRHTPDLYAALNATDSTVIFDSGWPIGASVSEGITGRLDQGWVDNSAKAQGGNVSMISLYANASTATWQGYFGNISRALTLGNSGVFYIFPSTGETKVFMSRTPSVDFSCIECSTAPDIAAEDSYLGKAAGDVDSAANVFSGSTHPAFYVSDVFIEADTCSATNLYVNGLPQASSFFEIIMNDAQGNTIYTGLTNTSTTGFDGGTYDYQMMVGVPYGEKATYYFFIEI